MNDRIYKSCLVCSKRFFKPYISYTDWTRRKYCSKKCYWSILSFLTKGRWKSGEMKGTTGLKPWNKNLTKYVSDFYMKMSKERSGSGNPMYGKKGWNKGLRYSLGKTSKNWKGDKVSYSGLHKWINKYKGKATQCQFCRKEGTRKEIQWANKSGKYKRDFKDWIALCAKCHYQYDRR